MSRIERELTARLRDLDDRLDVLEARQAAASAPPPMPALPVRYLAALEVVALGLAVADALRLPRVVSWGCRVGHALMARGVCVAARRGTPAQAAHGAHVFAKEKR